MKFSLVTTCWNEIRSLPRWRKDIEGQTRQPDEIVIVDNLSTDGTQKALAEWAAQDSKVRVIEKKCGAAQGRNIAIREAYHDTIISTDMGVTIDPRWFEEMAKPFEADTTVEVVAGNYCIDKSSVKSAAARAEYYLENGGFAQFGPDFVVGNRSVGYKRYVWNKIDGLPEDLTLYADDSVFGRQILQEGFIMAFAPKAIVYWTRPSRLRDFWKEQKNYGRGDGEALIKVPFAFRLWLSGKLPVFLVPFLTGVRRIHTGLNQNGILIALKRMDIIAIVFMPLLLFGNGWHFAKGFLTGFSHGNNNCQGSRARLKRPLLI